MPQQASGPPRRKGVSWMDLFGLFPTDGAAEQWFIRQRWGGAIACVRCGSRNVNPKTAHQTMPHRCRDCDKRFSVRMGTAMEGSKLGYQVWAIAIYALTTGIQGVALTMLHRDLNITQKSAWFLSRRIREAFMDKQRAGKGLGEDEGTQFASTMSEIRIPKRGRPVKHSMPEPIDATPDQVANTILATPPRKTSEWKFMQEHKS